MTPEKRCLEYYALTGARANLDTQFQTLHDYYDLEAENINTSYILGEELDFGHLFDTTSLSVADVLPAGIMNNLTPMGSQWMNLKHRNPAVMAKTKVGTWYKEAQDEVFYILGESNFYDQAFTFYKSSGVYGTSNIYGEADHEDVVRFQDFPVKQCHIVDDAKGRTNEYYLTQEWTAKQAKDKFGEENLSDTMKKELYQTGQGEKKHKFFLYIGPRYDRNVMKKDKGSMPFEGSWYDAKGSKLVQTGGFETLNAWTHRFYKRPNIAYGFSPAMKALMDVRYVQAMSYTELQEAMQQSQPAIAVPDDAFLQDIDFNNGAVNTYNSRSLTKDRIFPIGGYGDLNVNELMLEKKYAMIKEHMFYDVFLAFKDITKQMNNPEVFKRIQEGMTMLASPVGRYQDQFLSKAVGFTLNEAFKAGRLPEMPDELKRDPTYEIEYTSPLSLSHKQGEIQALQIALSMTAELANFKPEAADKINSDRAVDVFFSSAGADPSAKNDDDEVDMIRQAREQERQQIQELEQASAVAGIAKTGSETVKNMEGAA